MTNGFRTNSTYHCKGHAVTVSDQTLPYWYLPKFPLPFSLTVSWKYHLRVSDRWWTSRNRILSRQFFYWIDIKIKIDSIWYHSNIKIRIRLDKLCILTEDLKWSVYNERYKRCFKTILTILKKHSLLLVKKTKIIYN